jgi:hypothetical protein
LSVATSLAPAGRWLLDSGIQEPSGGFARYYDSETGKNRAVSTEISGYAASALVWLFRVTGDEVYLARARKTACFLSRAWDERLRTFPFEHPSPSAESAHQAWFFDCGIVVRGLLAVWRETGDAQLLEIASAAAHGMIANFRTGHDYHPILSLPGKEPLPRTDQWSRAPGCYQLKAALAWWEVGEITGENTLRDCWLEMLNSALVTHSSFLPGTSNPLRVMDRLHAYCYFLEALTPMLDRRDCSNVYIQGICAISKFLHEIAPAFARSDVYAQLLRARIYAAGVIPIDKAAAAGEAEALATFQARSGDPRIDGGFFFGRRDGKMSAHVNPVSTVFALQALELWSDPQSCHRTLI